MKRIQLKVDKKETKTKRIQLQVKSKRFDLKKIKTNRFDLKVKTNRFDLQTKPSNKMILSSYTSEDAIRIIKNSECYFSSSGTFSTQMLDCNTIWYRLTDNMREAWSHMVETKGERLVSVEIIRYYAILHLNGTFTNEKGFIIFEDKDGYERTYETKEESGTNSEKAEKNTISTKNGPNTKRRGRKKKQKS